MASDDSHTRIVRAFSEPSKRDEFDSQVNFNSSEFYKFCFVDSAFRSWL